MTKITNIRPLGSGSDDLKDEIDKGADSATGEAVKEEVSPEIQGITRTVRQHLRTGEVRVIKVTRPPLSPEERAAMQARLDELHDLHKHIIGPHHSDQPVGGTLRIKKS